MCLGEVDYGLYGVVGGLTGFVAFANGLMASAVARFYAFSVGAAHRDDLQGGVGLEDCRRWFSTALAIHSIASVVLILIGYPIGMWAVQHFLRIPPDRVASCVWVWRFVCISCFVGMFTVPFSAMYGAKQEIAELTIYGFVTTACNMVILYYMVSHDGDWLATYAGLSCLLSVVPSLIIGIRAVCIYPECRARRTYMFDFGRIKQVLIFASFRFAGAVTIIVQNQGVAILTNKLLGSARNAAMAVGGALSAHSATLSGALDGALSPAITNACGQGDYARMHSLCLYACKFSTVLMLVFALPLSLEVNDVMTLWLKNPPEYAGSLCVCMLICLILEKVSTGHWMAIFAFGKIGRYQLWGGVTGLIALMVSWLFILMGFDLLSIGIGLIAGKFAVVLVRLYFGSVIGGLSVVHWVRNVFCPILICLTAAIVVGLLPVLLVDSLLLRIVATTAVMELVFLPLAWRCLFSATERSMVIDRIQTRSPGLARALRRFE